MKRVLFFVIILCVGCSLYAQKKKVPVVSEEERRLSSLYAEGLKDFYSSNYTSAEKTFHTVLSMNPKHDASYFMLGKLKLEQKNYSDAASYFEQAVKLDKNNEWYQVELAQVYDLSGNYAESVKLWAALADAKPNIETYLIEEAEALVHLQRYTEVVKVYDKLEVLIGYNDELTETKKNIWLYLNNVKNAVGEYDKLIAEFPTATRYYVRAGDIWLTNNQPEKAYDYYSKAFAIDSNDVDLRFALAEYYDIKNNSNESWRHLLYVLKSPGCDVDKKLPTVQSIVTQYVLYGANSGFTKSEMYDMMNGLAKAHPSSAEVWAHLGTLKIMDQDYDEAQKYLKKSIDIDDSRYTVWGDYFFALSHQHMDEEIISEADRVMELFPGNAILLYGIGTAYLNVHNQKKAIEMLKLANSYSYEASLSAKIYEMMGNAYFELDQKSEAVNYWKMAKRKGSTSEDLDKKIKDNE